MSQICRSSKNVSEGNSRSKFVKIAACILAVAFLMVSGCSNGDKKENKTSNSASSTAQQSSKAANSPESALSQFGVKGKVVNSTFGNKPDGFMAKVDNKIYLVDLKNNQIASIENYSYIDTQIDKIRGRDNSQGTLIPQFLIYNDKHGKDDQMGEWRGNNHFLPIYILIQFDAAGNLKSRGKMSSGLGAAPSHYQGYLEEQKDIDLANLFLREVIPFKDTLDNKAAKDSTNKPVATTNGQAPTNNGYVVNSAPQVKKQKMFNPVDTPQSVAIMKGIVAVSSSSALKEGNKVFSASNIIDKNNHTCWADGVPGLGIGESITINFNQKYNISGFRIFNGYQKSEDLFNKNSRPNAFRIIGSDGSTIVCSFEDSIYEQDIYFDKMINVDSIKLVIEKVQRGTKYEDTCISEVTFF